MTLTLTSRRWPRPRAHCAQGHTGRRRRHTGSTATGSCSVDLRSTTVLVVCATGNTVERPGTVTVTAVTGVTLALEQPEELVVPVLRGETTGTAP
jgi:hypothetical protein